MPEFCIISPPSERGIHRFTIASPLECCLLQENVSTAVMGSSPRYRLYQNWGGLCLVMLDLYTRFMSLIERLRRKLEASPSWQLI